MNGRGRAWRKGIKNFRWPQDVKRRISESIRGKTHSELTKKKIAEQARVVWAKRKERKANEDVSGPAHRS